MLFEALVEASAVVAGTRSRLAKTAAIAEVLAAAGPTEAAMAAAYLSGILPQRRVGVSWRGLADLPAAAPTPNMTIDEVDARLTDLAGTVGTGSQRARAQIIADLFGRATAAEQIFLRDLITGNMRQGAQDGVMLAAIAAAAGVPETAVRRAVMLAGFAAPVAEAALSGGEEALAAIGLEVGRPLRPMLAGSGSDAAAGFAAIDAAAGVIADGKLDGIRIQAHRRGGDIRLFTRSLDDITARLPEVVDAVAALPVESVILDGEAIALDPAGRPLPFQVTASRTMSSADVEHQRRTVPVHPFFFDLLHLDGEDLIDRPAADRFARLATLVPAAGLVPRREVADAAAADDYLAGLLAQGHEGIVLKSAAAPYAAGRRGAGWVKVKPRLTLDLVVLAVEWGSGRRRGKLSNIHLGARDADGGFVMLGKTFKGMTDAMLAWQTERFLELETSRAEHVVYLKPEQVVEIAFDGLQRSTRYPGGLALRFARVLRYRDDKTAEEADTIDTVRALAGGVSD